MFYYTSISFGVYVFNISIYEHKKKNNETFALHIKYIQNSNRKSKKNQQQTAIANGKKKREF